MIRYSKYLFCALFCAALFQTGNAQQFNPVAWPSSFTPYTISGAAIKDPAIQDPSNGGTSPQGYVNVASGTPDQSEPSVYYAFNGSTIFIRFRVESRPTTYAGGAAASNTDPWYSASWVFLIDVNGDGWRDFAIFLDGNSGGPSNSIDDIRVIYANNKTTQSIDPSSTAGVHELTRIKTAQTYSSGAYAGELEQFDGNANVITTNVWPNGKYTTWYDFGTTRTIDSTASGAGWFIDFQVPLSALDASAYGGPTVTASTPLSFVFTTANSNTNPFQKDAALQGSSTITLTSTTPMPGGDLTSFNGTVISAPIIQSIAATTCPNVTLTADVLARSEVSGGSVVSSVQSVNFYYWYDSNGDGVANDAGSSWTLIGGGTQGPLGTWKKNWTTSSLAQGVYLIKAVATDDASNSTDSYTQNYSGYGSTIAYMNNNCGTSPPYMTKTVTPSSVQASGTTAQRTVTYTITITNPGSAGDSVSSITDYLPTGFSYQANAAGGSMTPTTSPTNGATGTIKWTFSPSKVVAAGGSDSLKFTVLAGTATGTYTNTASAAGSTSIDSVTNTAPVVVSDTSLSLTKTISPTGLLLPGDSFTYTIAYTNTGNVALSNVVLVDTLVAGINFVSATNSGSYSNNKVTWNLGSLSPGASGSVSVSGTVSNPFSGSSPLNDRAKATATELSSPAYSNTVSSTIASPVLTINLSASPTNLSPGDVVTYTMTYGNTGTASATNDTITTTLPSKLTYISGSASTTPTSASGQVLKWGFSSIASGSVNNTITFQATVGSYASAVQSDPITDTAFISSSQTSSAQSSASVYVTAVPNVTITKTADSSAYNGTTAKFKLTLTNYGNAAATITSLVDSLPSGFTYVSGSSQGMATANPTGTTGRIVWSTLVRTSLAVGATDTLVFQATISSTAGTYTNTGRAKGTLTTAGTSDSVTSTVSIVKNATTGAVRYKTVDKASAYVGDTLTYTIYFQNNTGGNQNNLNIIDTLVSGLTYLSYTGSGSASGGVRSFTNSPSNVLNWKIGNPFRAGQDYTLIVKIGINSNVTNGTVLTNYAHVVGTFDSTTTTVSTTALVPPRISITKEVSQTSAAPNTILTYTIVYRDSSGAGSSTNTQIIDTLLSNKLVYVVGSANKGGAYSSVSGNGGRLAWNLGTIAGGTTDSVSFEAKDTASSGSVSNVAWMKDNEGKKVSSSVSTTTAAYPVLSLSKSVDKTLAGPSDTLTYTLTLNNSGTGSASSVVLNDATPSNTTFISASPAATSAPSVGGTGTVSWNIGAFAVGSSSYTIKVKINSPLASGSVSSITNSASLTSTQVPSLTSNIVTTTVNYPSLLINKTVDKVSAAPGDTLTYSLTISNGSLISSTSTTMVDTIPSNTSFVSATGGGTLSGGRITWNLGTLAANANSTVTFKVKASSPLSNGTKISNIAYATTNKLTDTVSSNTAQTTIQSSPTLTLTKSVNNGTSTPGSTLTYTLTYGNTGNSDATSFSLTDNIPSNTSYVLGSVTGTGASYDITGNRIVVYRSTLTAGTTNQTVTFQVRIASPLLAGTYTITNSATAAASNASSATASATTTVTATPTITISKTAPTISYLHGSPTARDTVTFTISYSITGKAIVDSEYVNDVLPSGLTYLSSSPSATSVSGQTVKWSLGTSTPDTSGELTVTAWTATAGTYTNSAKLTSSYSPSGTTSDTTSTQIVNTVTGTIGQNSPITPGGTVTVTVNDADLKGDGVIFIETKNTRTGETENLGLQETGTNTGIFTGTVSTTFGTSAGTNNNGIFNVQANDSIRGRYIDQYNASGATDTVYAYTQVSGGYTATISANPTLIAADDSSTFTLTDHDLNKNSSLVESYTLTVKNSTGETEAMIFTETGANTGIFTKKVPTVYGTPPGTNNDGHFTVQAGDTISVSYLDSLTATGDTATISAFFRIGTVDYSTSSKSVQDLNGGQVQPPDTLQYTIKIKNSGTASAKAITVKDTLPSGVTVLASTISNSGSASGQVITWSFSTITNGDSLTLTYQVYVDSSIQSNVAAVNRAHIVSSGVDQLDTASFTPVNRPLMTMTKSVSSTSGRMRPGDTLVYTINYKNTGTATATYVSVSDPNPNNTTYVLNSVTLNAVPKTDVADGDEVTVSSNTITVSVGTVTPGQTGVITFRVRIQ